MSDKPPAAANPVAFDPLLVLCPRTRTVLVIIVPDVIPNVDGILSVL